MEFAEKYFLTENRNSPTQVLLLSVVSQPLYPPQPLSLPDNARRRWRPGTKGVSAE